MEKNIESLIIKQLENILNSDETMILKDWVLKDDNAKIYRKYITDYYKNYDFAIPQVFNQFEKDVLNNQDAKFENRTPWSIILAYAAVFIGILSTGLFAYYQSTSNTSVTSKEITLQMDDGSFRTLKESAVTTITTQNGLVLGQQNQDQLIYKAPTESITEIVYNTLRVPNGKRFRVQLSDNTIVHLNSGSSLRYPVHFIQGKLREVYLEGEGYFKVSKDKDHPFIVRTKTTNTEVFGTEFNVSSYTDNKQTSVVLVEGSVGVFKIGKRYVKELGTRLKPNEMASISEGKDIIVDAVTPEDHVAWIDGVLVFKKESFSSILKKIERHFDVTIKNNNAQLADKKFTGRFDIEAIDQVLKIFTKTNPFVYSIQGREIIINP